MLFERDIREMEKSGSFCDGTTDGHGLWRSRDVSEQQRSHSADVFHEVVATAEELRRAAMRFPISSGSGSSSSRSSSYDGFGAFSIPRVTRRLLELADVAMAVRDLEARADSPAALKSGSITISNLRNGQLVMIPSEEEGSGTDVEGQMVFNGEDERADELEGGGLVCIRAYHASNFVVHQLPSLEVEESCAPMVTRARLFSSFKASVDLRSLMASIIDSAASAERAGGGSSIRGGSNQAVVPVCGTRQQCARRRIGRQTPIAITVRAVFPGRHMPEPTTASVVILCPVDR
jgi:hypothetical protein